MKEQTGETTEIKPYSGLRPTGPISEVFNEDNMVGMARYPDKFFDLAVVDPPYGINAANMQMGSGAKSRGGRTSTAVILKRNGTSTAWDKKAPDAAYFKELFRVSKNQIIWGGNYFDLPPTRCVICWDKRQPWDNFSQWEMAWTSFNKPAPIFRHGVTGGSNSEHKIHPTQKPVALYSWLLSKFSQPGDKILDTHMGSQSSRIAAYRAGLDYYGWELDPGYFEAGCKRFKEQTAQLQLNFNQ